MPNVYEADFKGFFDSIDLNGLSQVLNQTLGLPEREVDFIENLNKSLVKLTEKDEIKEPERDIPFTKYGELNMQSGVQFLPGPILLKVPNRDGKKYSPSPEPIDMDS
jgi:hypothetical protein